MSSNKFPVGVLVIVPTFDSLNRRFALDAPRKRASNERPSGAIWSDDSPFLGSILNRDAYISSLSQIQ